MDTVSRITMTVLVFFLLTGCRGSKIEPAEYADRMMRVLHSMGALPDLPPGPGWQPRFETAGLPDSAGAGADHVVWKRLDIQKVAWGDEELRFGFSVAYPYPDVTDYGDEEFEILVLVQNLALPFVREGVCVVRVVDSDNWSVVDAAERIADLDVPIRSPTLTTHIQRMHGGY